MGMPWRTRNWAIDFFARVTTGFWPAMRMSSSAATSTIFAFWVASPSPRLITTFVIFGVAITLAYPNSFCSAGATSPV